MRKVYACVLVTVAAVILAVAGCSNGVRDSQSSGTNETSVKTMDDYRSEAEKAITGDNAQEELDKIEKEIDAEQ